MKLKILNIVLGIAAAFVIGYDFGAYFYSTVDVDKVAKQWISDNCNLYGDNTGHWYECERSN